LLRHADNPNAVLGNAQIGRRCVLCNRTNHRRLLFVIGAMCSIRRLLILSIQALFARPT
jgi:hypothetical protein